MTPPVGKVTTMAWKHGTRYGYDHKKCRCVECTKARQGYDAGRYVSNPKIRSQWEHGTITGYTKHKCRCDACTTARREYDAARYQRLNQYTVAARKA